MDFGFLKYKILNLSYVVTFGIATVWCPCAIAQIPGGFEAEQPYYAGEATVEVVDEMPRYRLRPPMVGQPDCLREEAYRQNAGGGDAHASSSSSSSSARARQEAALATYQAEVKQEIDRWLENGSAKATMKAHWDAPSTQPIILQTGTWALGAVNETLVKMGLRGISSSASTIILGFTSIWSFMDGLLGIENKSIQNNELLKQNLENAAAKYWETVNAE